MSEQPLLFSDDLQTYLCNHCSRIPRLLILNYCYFACIGITFIRKIAPISRFRERKIAPITSETADFTRKIAFIGNGMVQLHLMNTKMLLNSRSVQKTVLDGTIDHTHKYLDTMQTPARPRMILNSFFFVGLQKIRLLGQRSTSALQHRT